MAEQTRSCPDDPAPDDGIPGDRAPGRWWLALVPAFLMLAGLDWLLARLIWLPYYCGLFFFLVAGLLVGAVSFRLARPARPVGKASIITGIALVGVASSLVTTVWEYRNVAATAGGERRFADARNAAVAEARPVGEVEAAVTREFVSALRVQYAPGGPIGYVLWAIASGEMDLTVRDCRDTVSINHRGLVWLIRSFAAMLLLLAGLWLSFESLRSARPVSNILLPGEEAEEEA